jgi:sugar lactone lactonase YvrE
MGGSTSSSTTSTTTTSTTSSTGTGGSTPFMGMLGPIADARTALDATPDPAGNTIYFIAIDPTTKAAGVYKAPSDGSAMTPVVVASGAPFATPFGIATSTDGMQLYIADPGATDTVSKQDLGVIFSLPVGGGTPTILSGSELFGPRSLEVAVEGGKDVLYYTGRDKTTGVAGVFKIPASGGASTAVTATGVTFVDPSGIAIASDGTVYVADTTASASRTANIVKIDKNGTATTLLSNLQVGYPCGVAVSKDDKTLLISALDSAKGTDVLLQVDIATAMQGMSISMGIDTFTESAGLHRAKGSDMYAWADSSAGASNGRVFVVK